MKIFGLIENMSGFVCPHCGETVDIFGSGGGERTAAAASIPFLGRIPMDPRVVACGDDGCSVQEKYTDSEAAKAIARIADKVAALV